MSSIVRVKDIAVGRPGPLALICGPCVVESREHALKMASSISSICRELDFPLIYKSSYTKANRTSGTSFRGLGMDAGLKILAEVRNEFGLAVVSDVHSEEEARSAGAALDLIQIPAFLCRQSALLETAGQTGKPVMVKKGQFVAPEDMKFAVDKIRNVGNQSVLLCERGSCFGYRELVVDFRALSAMRATGCPVVFDATHSVQIMGGADGRSSGRREFVPALARAAVSWGVDAIFLECHDAPERAPSDGPNMIPLDALKPLLTDLKALHSLKLETRSPDGL